MHWKEDLTTTNTARIAALCLPNSQIRIRGRRDAPTSADNMLCEEGQNLFLFPSERAIELTPEYVASLKRPIHLIVPDGSWRQAKRVGRREPALADVPHVKLPRGKPTEYVLRKEPNEDALCTFEAIARAMGTLESKEIQDKLEEVFRLMMRRVLDSRSPP